MNNKTMNMTKELAEKVAKDAVERVELAQYRCELHIPFGMMDETNTEKCLAKLRKLLAERLAKVIMDNRWCWYEDIIIGACIGTRSGLLDLRVVDDDLSREMPYDVNYGDEWNSIGNFYHEFIQPKYHDTTNWENRDKLVACGYIDKAYKAQWERERLAGEEEEEELEISKDMASDIAKKVMDGFDLKFCDFALDVLHLPPHYMMSDENREMLLARFASNIEGYLAGKIYDYQVYRNGWYTVEDVIDACEGVDGLLDKAIELAGSDVDDTYTPCDSPWTAWGEYYYDYLLPEYQDPQTQEAKEELLGEGLIKGGWQRLTENGTIWVSPEDEDWYA